MRPIFKQGYTTCEFTQNCDNIDENIWQFHKRPFYFENMLEPRHATLSLELLDTDKCWG